MKHVLFAMALCAFGTYAATASDPDLSSSVLAPAMSKQPSACAARVTDEGCADGAKPQWIAADAGCQNNCESRLSLCLKEANTDAIREKCKVYFKGCLKSCTQGK